MATYKELPETYLVPHSVNNLLWYLLGRAFIVTLFLGGAVFVGLSSSFFTLKTPDARLIFLLSVTFLQICLSLMWLLRWPHRLRLFVQFQLVWDLILSVLTVYFTGGIASLFPFLFIFVILSCALMSTRAEVFVTVSAAVILYGGLVDLQYYGYLNITSVPISLSDADIVFRLFLNVTAFLLAGFLGSILSTRLRHSEHLLQRERDDYAELEHLNSIILQSIPSGLIVVNSEGIIRSFNRAAESICGVPSSQACQLSLSQLFPQLSICADLLPVERGELNYANDAGESRIIGYNATPISACDHCDVGVLITFQDLTEARRLEQNLQIGERLAAVGKLAAGLAHEIRNPLASLSGSVQLLAEQVTFDREDQYLIDIVNRETIRLNRLLTEFLGFARPRAPQREMCDLVAVIEEVIVLAKADPLFLNVEILCDCQKEWIVEIDPGQIHQALWNLLVNAAQFALLPKKVLITINPQERVVWIDDNGPGVSVQEKKQIFEPFYSSRAEGTGLGLSIVHSIITSHGGTIECHENPWGGARFQVTLAR